MDGSQPVKLCGGPLDGKIANLPFDFPRTTLWTTNSVDPESVYVRRDYYSRLPVPGWDVRQDADFLGDWDATWHTVVWAVESRHEEIDLYLQTDFESAAQVFYCSRFIRVHDELAIECLERAVDRLLDLT